MLKFLTYSIFFCSKLFKILFANFVVKLLDCANYSVDWFISLRFICLLTKRSGSAVIGCLSSDTSCLFREVKGTILLYFHKLKLEIVLAPSSRFNLWYVYALFLYASRELTMLSFLFMCFCRSSIFLRSNIWGN